MSDAPIAAPPKTDSSVSLHPLKQIEYPPNAFFAFAMCFPPPCGGTPSALARGDYYHMYEGRKSGNTIPWGFAAVRKIHHWGIGRWIIGRPSLHRRPASVR